MLVTFARTTRSPDPSAPGLRQGILLKLGVLGVGADAGQADEELAVAMCPNVADHPEVGRYCLQPTASALLSSAIQAELAESLPDGRPITIGGLT